MNCLNLFELICQIISKCSIQMSLYKISKCCFAFSLRSKGKTMALYTKHCFLFVSDLTGWLYFDYYIYIVCVPQLGSPGKA